MRPCLGRLLILFALLGSAALPATAWGQQGVLELEGGPEAATISVFVDSETGQLVVRDPAGIEPPGEPCEPPPGAPTTEFRCPAGAIGAIVGHLGGGDDSLLVAPDLAVRIGARVDGVSRPLHGGPGADLLRSGSASDLLLGGRGGDRLLGRAGPDLIRAGAGRDRLLAGTGADALYGGPGPDLLRGGSGPDLCRGGPGRDRVGSCALRR